MKLFIDPVYTNVPAKCASTIKMKKTVDQLLAWRPDIFVYWLIPDWTTEEDNKFFTQSPRVKLIPYPYSKDRYREFNRLDRQLETMLSFQGDLWDFDLVLTNRTSMVPFMKTVMFRPSSITTWAKRVFLIEDMPIMTFKKTVAMSHPRAQEIMTLGGYLLADTTAISAFWEKKLVLQEMRNHYTPAAMKHVEDTMIESSPVKVEKVGVKDKKHVQEMLDKKRPFTIGWVGRMTHGTRSDDVFELMGKHWVYNDGKGKKIKCVAYTNSLASGRVKVPSWVEIKQLPREEFWTAVRETMDVYVCMATEEDYSMSLMEPLMLGCPVVLIRAHWSVPTVGEDYPFFVGSVAEAYAMVRLFYNDYVPNYKKFVEWSKRSLEPLLLERNKVYVPDLVQKEIVDLEREMAIQFKANPVIATNEIVDMLDKHGKKKGELTIFDAIEAMSDQFRSLHKKVTDENFAERVKLNWGTEWNRLRLGLMARGYVDASINVGHMKLPKKGKTV